MEGGRRGAKRPCGGAVLQLHQEAQCQPPACKRRCREEQEMRRRRAAGGADENRDPGDVLQRNPGTQRRERRRFSQYRTRTRTRTVAVAQLQPCRPEVRVALIQKTRIQNSNTTELRSSDLNQGVILTEQTQQDQTRPVHVRWIRTSESNPELRSRSTVGPVSESRISRTQSVLGPESSSRTRTTSETVATKTKRRTKVPPSVFRGRGQLRLSITPEAGQLILHIHEAQGLMAKSERSCDSFVQLTVTSDLHRIIKMKTQTILNNKNPEYNCSFTLCISDDLILHRLLVSVFIRRRRLIGCMSFGIDSLVFSSKHVTGWFHLLGAELGRRKHLRVTSRSRKSRRSLKGERAAEDAPSRLADLRKTPEPAPDPNLKPSAATSAATARLEDLTNRRWTCGFSQNLDSVNANYGSHTSTPSTHSDQQQETRTNSSQQLGVNVVRGKDGFGFTICSDCPVRVQAVDAGGPAHQSGLCQGDLVLQLNGLPVETWKCVDLAHAIRSSPSHIAMVVWRGLPELRSRGPLPRPQTHNTTTGRKLLRQPAHSKQGRRQGQGPGLRSSLGALGSLWRDRKDEDEDHEQEVAEYSTGAAMLNGTRVTSSHGDNYIILSPVNTGAQLLQPVYPDRHGTIGTIGTIGRLYQTHPSRGHSLLHEPRPSLLQRPFSGCTSTLPPPTSSASAPPTAYANYQNCTIVQSHVPCSSYGTYATLAPKTLIFPVSVQPLDLCSPDRTLLMAEEMLLHQDQHRPAKVTVLIYSDLLLLTREDDTGRCNVLQSPLYLNTLQLREVPSEPLLLHFLRRPPSEGIFSLEAFSVEQKLRVSLCLHDIIQLHQSAAGPGHAHRGHALQLSDISSDFGLLSVRQSDLLYHPSSPYSSDPPLLHPCSSVCDPIRPSSPPLYSPGSPFTSSSPPLAVPPLSPFFVSSSPPLKSFTRQSDLQPLPPCSATQKSLIWKDRGGAEEEEEDGKIVRQEEVVEERQQGEGESASETSENMGGVWGRGLHFSPLHFKMQEEEGTDEEEEGGACEGPISKYRPEGLRRSLSEGSLMKEPRSPRFLSDSTIHRLTGPSPLDLGTVSRPPSIHTLRKQLTREGGSLHHILLLLNGNKEDDGRNLQLKKKTKSLAADVRGRLAFLRGRRNSRCFHGNSLEKALRNNRPSTKEVLRWAESLEALFTNQYGLAVFRHFLRSEFSEENLDFWLAVEKFKETCPLNKMAARAAKIYEEFISTSAGRQVNVDSSVRESTRQSLRLGVSPASFQLAQDQIFSLMETDSYPRFLRSRLYRQLANRGEKAATEMVVQSRGSRDGTGTGAGQ